MSLTAALYTGLSGLDVNSKSLDVIGNNITNVNTSGFKSDRAVFESQLSHNLTLGTGPTATSGGINPSQIGLGVLLGGTKRNFNNGSIQPSGVNTDLALEGAGFFIVNQNGTTAYTRNGNFDLDAQNNLSTITGGIVQGFGIDTDFNIIPGQLTNINIPVGTLTLAEATQNVSIAGNLNASGTVGSLNSITTTQALEDSTAPGTIAGTTLLANTRVVGSVTNAFSAGEVITIQGAEKGGKALPTLKFAVGTPPVGTIVDASGTTVADLMTFIQDALGINVDPSIGDGAGVTLNGSGQIQIKSNFGTVNDVAIQTADLFTNGVPAQPLVFSKSQSANGESVRTTFQVFDSLGTPLSVDITMVLESKTSNGTIWRFFAESSDDTDVSLALEDAPAVGGSGTLSFNTFGQLASTTPINITIDRTSTGAVDPLVVQLNFAATGQPVTALTDKISQIAATFQDGSPIGTLASFSIGEDGVITGAFSNGLNRSLGQVAVATFANPEGLTDAGRNLYLTGPNSGTAVNVAPLTFGAGRIIAGALELSNVDLSQEFVNLITASTGFSAASKVITTSDQLIQELLAVSR